MIELFFIIVAVEAITEILTKSSLFYPIRRWLFGKSKANRVASFLHALLDCGYCTSVWISSFLTLFYMSYLRFTNVWVLDYIIMAMVVHKGSNVLHFLIDLLAGLKDRFNYLGGENS